MQPDPCEAVRAAEYLRGKLPPMEPIETFSAPFLTPWLGALTGMFAPCVAVVPSPNVFYLTDDRCPHCHRSLRPPRSSLIIEPDVVDLIARPTAADVERYAGPVPGKD